MLLLESTDSEMAFYITCLVVIFHTIYTTCRQYTERVLHIYSTHLRKSLFQWIVLLENAHMHIPFTSQLIITSRGNLYSAASLSPIRVSDCCPLAPRTVSETFTSSVPIYTPHSCLHFLNEQNYR